MHKKFSPEHWSLASVLYNIDKLEGKLKPYQKNGLETSPDDYLRKAWNILKKENEEQAT